MSSLDAFTFPVVVADSRHKGISEKKPSHLGEFIFRGKTELAKNKVDNESPVAQVHHYFKLSKIQDSQRKFRLLEQENKSLSIRLANIYRGSGMVDCWNEYQQKSVFRQKQNVDNIRISMENQAILKRIKERKPTYDTKQSELEWKNSRKYIKKNPRLMSSDPEKIDFTITHGKTFGAAQRHISTS